MSQLANIITSADAESGVLLRRKAYGKKGIREFLRDVLAMANASVDGVRHIIVGAEPDSGGARRLFNIDAGDFIGTPPYETLVGEYIEPPIRIRYESVPVNGKRVGVFELADCQDRPYMMRIDYSEKLRRGDAYVRVNDTTMKMGRKQLQYLFEKKFRDSVCSTDIEIGFPGEIIHKGRDVPTCDLGQLPSALASGKLKKMLEIRENSSNSGSTSRMARLMHARLYGSDDPYVNRSPEELLQELERVPGRYEEEDRHFLYEEQAEELQLVACNQGEETIRDAALSIVMPNHEAFYVAEHMLDRQPGYPQVSLRDQSIHVTSKIGDIEAGKPVELFDRPLRLCAGKLLTGYRFSVRYSLFGQNLRAPAKGKLRLAFA